MANTLFTRHSYSQLIHTFPTRENAFEQGFSSLSTETLDGYYYDLYIKETCPQANPTGYKRVTQTRLAVQDFQLKKKRVTA